MISARGSITGNEWVVEVASRYLPALPVIKYPHVRHERQTTRSESNEQMNMFQRHCVYCHNGR
jgi:hypothetical protein